MPVTRICWDDLPRSARQAVEECTGPMLRAEQAAAGANSGIAVTLHTPTGPVFVKGLPSDHPQIRTQHREAAIAPHLPAACPRLLWHVQVAGWDLLGYERLTGRHADYRPGSPDLALVAHAVDELRSITLPSGVPVKDAAQRWAGYTDGDPSPFAGSALLHTDLAPHNVLIGQRAHLIDWAWPTVGAAWIDPAVLILRLMEAGHSAPAADTWAREHLPAWADAPHGAALRFGEANARAWDEIARNEPQPWKKRMARHAHDWVTYWRAA
ncbi:aminoglycoside phosphotransferase [Streptomyces sp. CA-250714]|uniref:aminoglycoside phosphotransferase n=1 Tax=Streptomyces sp. CA-250714 TaxID=3240060 RepID=UPI003D8D4B55